MALPFLRVFAFCLAWVFLLPGLPASAATPSFTLAAQNTSLPATGSGLISFTLTSVDGYTGSLALSCSPPSLSTSVKLPGCGGGPFIATELASNAQVQGGFSLLAYGAPVPLAPAMLLLGLGLWKRRKISRATLVLLGLGTLASLGAITGCATPPGYTPGTYTYTLTATDLKSQVTVSTTSTVTIH